MFKESTHRYCFVAGLMILAAGLPFSNFMMSIGQFVLIINWVLEGKIGKKLSAFFRDYPALIFSAIFVLHLAGLIYTSDFQYALKDLRIKIPLLLLPLVVSTSARLSRAEFQIIVNTFLTFVLVSSGVTMYMVFVENVLDPRQASPLISHIRLGLMMCIAIAFSVYFAYIYSRHRIYYLILAVWVFAGLILLESFTGIVIFIVLLSYMLFWFSRQLTIKRLTSRMLVLAVVIPLLFAAFVFVSARQYFSVPDVAIENLDTLTPNGRHYMHDIEQFPLENGQYTGLYVCFDELRSEWNKRSTLNFDSLDHRKQMLSSTLIRYMTSLSLRKDSAGIWQLSERDIRNVEIGIANFHYTRQLNPRKRLMEFFWEYSNYRRFGDPSGHSVMQRIAYWETAHEIFAANWLIGVGTGDIDSAFKEKYIENNTPLKPKFRLRAHNQFLTIAVAFGIFGLLVFLSALFAPAIINRQFRSYLFVVFFITAMLSMINEDTLETQAGVSFFAFFYTVLVLGLKAHDDKQQKDVY